MNGAAETHPALTVASSALEQLQILHSRICRQLDLEYLTDPEGRHPITCDRLHELQIEFTSRLLG